jgi:hypothetical protein
LDEDELLMLLISTPGQQQGRHSIPVRIVKLRTRNIIKKMPVSAKRDQFFSLHILKTKHEVLGGGKQGRARILNF